MCSCNPEPEVLIDSNLQPYVDRFVEEAAQRNMAIDFEELGIEIRLENLDPGVAGQCYTRSESGNLIVIDRVIWLSKDDLEKEWLLFHELGHCQLGRSHEDETDTAGFCKSIMHSSAEVCNMNEDESLRSIYLDELFSL